MKEKLTGIEKKGKVLLFVLTVLLVITVNAGANTLIFVIAPLRDSKSLNKSLMQNLKTLSKETKKAGFNFIPIVAAKSSFFVYGSKKQYDDLFTAVFSEIKKLPEKEKIYLIFAGHSDDEKTFLITETKTYSIEELLIFLGTVGRKIHFLGFDTCEVGSFKNLKLFSRYADIVAGTGIDEPAFGWQGIYDHFSEIVTSKSFVSEMMKYYLSFYRKKMTAERKEFIDSGLNCTSLNIVKDKALTAGAVCVY